MPQVKLSTSRVAEINGQMVSQPAGSIVEVSKDEAARMIAAGSASDPNAKPAPVKPAAGSKPTKRGKASAEPVVNDAATEATPPADSPAETAPAPAAETAPAEKPAKRRPTPKPKKA